MKKYNAPSQEKMNELLKGKTGPERSIAERILKTGRIIFVPGMSGFEDLSKEELDFLYSKNTLVKVVDEQ